MGRSSILETINPELINKAIDLIEKGNYAQTAFQALGICERTYYQWLENGKNDVNNGLDTIYVQFLHRVKDAEGIAEASLIDCIKNAASPVDNSK